MIVLLFSIYKNAACSHFHNIFQFDHRRFILLVITILSHLTPAIFHCSRWHNILLKKAHLRLFGDRPISDLYIPGSHDAGASRLGLHPIFGTESNVLTQPRSIFELEVRRTDIRPTLTSQIPSAGPGNLACGHHTGKAEKIGRQGGNYLEIREAIDDLNHFTKDNAELVIVDITHFYRISIDNPTKSTRRGPTTEKWAMTARSLIPNQQSLHC